MATIEFNLDRDEFVIHAPTLIPQIGEWVGWARRAGKGNVYSARAWASSVLTMRSIPGHELQWSPPAESKRRNLLNRLSEARASLSAGSAPLSGWTWPTERKPKPHQRRAIAAIAHMDYRVQLGDDMGLGKTSVALWAAWKSQVRSLVVVCPVSTKFNWQEEFAATLGDVFTVFVIDGSPKKRADQLAEALNAQKHVRVALIVNYDLLCRFTPDQLTAIELLVKDGMVIFDECHYLKSQTSDRSKLSSALGKLALFVLGLSGTPIRNLADDLYQQVQIIRPGTWTSYRDFAKRHLIINAVKFGKREVQKVVGVKNLDELNLVMNTLQIRRKKSEVLDLPPKIRTYPQLELEGDLLAFYKAMKDFARIELAALLQQQRSEDAPPMSIFNPRAKSAVEAAMRCEQIAQGFIGGIPEPVMQKIDVDLLLGAEKIEGRPNELIFPNAPKLVWLLEAIETVLKQGGTPAVITRFNAPGFWLVQKLRERNISARFLHGGLLPTTKHGVVQDFQDKRFDALIAQVKMCEGWNATRCNDVLFLGRDWSPAINEQAEDRFYRIGTTGTVNVQVPLVRKTVEVMIDRRLRAKDADAEQALRTCTIQELMEAL